MPSPFRIPFLSTVVTAVFLAIFCANVAPAAIESLGYVESQNPRLRSAGRLRVSGDDRGRQVSPADERARLRNHFDAVVEILEKNTRASLEPAIERITTGEGPLNPRQRHALRLRLTSERSRQLSVLRGYRDAGVFPVNQERTDRAIPIFVDRYDTACAIGFLMRESGWAADVAKIAASDNWIFVDDARAGQPLLAWIKYSGLTREEAALIQPGYAPQADVFLDDILAAGSRFENGVSSFSNFTFDAVLVSPGGESQAPATLVDPDNHGLLPHDAGGNNLSVISRRFQALARTLEPFGEDGTQLRIRFGFDVESLDPMFGVSGARLDSIFQESFTPFPGQVVSILLSSPGDLIIESRIFDQDVLIASLVVEETLAFDGFHLLDDRDSVSFAPRSRIRVETEALISGPVHFGALVHGFDITPIPEPGTATLLGLGLLMLAQSRRGAGSLPPPR